MILDKFPNADAFYKHYWCKKPFIVRGHVPASLIETLVDGETLAGMALEHGIKSRIITNSAAGNDWVCEHGPFEEARFHSTGEKNWSLLVQNVEQYHTDTANLLPYFQFSPRWLLDDVMVSYSAPGGSVGPHTDSYHTFLVQGMGKRRWKISAEPVHDDRYVDNPDVKVLKHGFEGDFFDVETGDVIYMPPFFGHEGKTTETAMTFSVGFLGPRLSEILGEYAYYLEEHDAINARYYGDHLDVNSAGFSVGAASVETIKDSLIASIQSEDFKRWMAAYFSTPSHEDIDPVIAPHAPLQNDDILYRPEHVKMAITPSSEDCFNLAVFGNVITVSAAQSKLIERLNNGQDIALNTLKDFGDADKAIALLKVLYQEQALYLRHS